MDRDRMLDAAEEVVARQGIANVTLEAVAAAAGLSKGGLLHHFRTKDDLVEALVRRAADGWRNHFQEAYDLAPEGPGRMARGILAHCLTDAKSWTDQLRRSTSSVFAALAQNPALIEPMREVYVEIHRRIDEDGLPPGVGDTVMAAADGLWLNWVLGFAPVDQKQLDRVRRTLEHFLAHAEAARPPAKRKVAARPAKVAARRRGGRR